MNETVLVPAALFASGYRDGEFHAIVGTDHSSFVDRTQVRSDRLPMTPDDQVQGYVMAFVIKRGPEETLVELPGVAVGALRGLVPNLDIEPW